MTSKAIFGHIRSLLWLKTMHEQLMFLFLYFLIIDYAKIKPVIIASLLKSFDQINYDFDK